MKKVFSSQDITYITSLQNLLESNHIPCLIKNLYLTGAMGGLPPNECWLELWIFDDTKYHDAQTLITNFQTAPVNAKPWQCPKCGEWIEGQFTDCWKCAGSR